MAEDIPDNPSSVPNGDESLRQDAAAANHWAFILPFVVFLIVAQFYPKFDPPAFDDAEQIRLHYSGLATRFICLLIVQVALSVGLLIYFGGVYLRSFPIRVSPLAIVVGIVGVVLWIAVCSLSIEPTFFEAIGLKQLAQTRSGFNPLEMIGDQGLLFLFMVLRFSVLALIVPLVEELFLRGWLVRFATDAEWWKVTLANVGLAGVMAAAVYGVVTHPSEAIAAALWFSLVSWLMIRTGNFWDCVVAHAVTNLLLGIYILFSGAWQLW